MDAIDRATHLGVDIMLISGHESIYKKAGGVEVGNVPQVQLHLL